MVKSAIHAANYAAFTPAETTELICRAGVKKGHFRADKIFLSAVSGGCILSFGCGVSLIALTAPWYQENAPGLIKIIGAFVFPLGLVTVMLTGADLFTSTNMVCSIHSTDIMDIIFDSVFSLHWWPFFIESCLFGECYFTGPSASLATLLALFLSWWSWPDVSLWRYHLFEGAIGNEFADGGLFENDPYKAEVIAFTTKKQVVPAMHQIFIRAIGCNWLVCLACFLGTQAKELSSKVIGIWLPVFAFVALGFDHVVANMFFMPLGIWLHTPGLTISLYIWKGELPVFVLLSRSQD